MKGYNESYPLMKILLFANTDWFLYNFCLSLAQALKERGDEVLLVSPSGSYAPRLQEMGFRWLPFKLERRSLNPLTELRTIIGLFRLYKSEKPDVIHHFTVKCVLYGSIAGRLSGIHSIVNEVTGLGYVFMDGEGPRRWLQILIKTLYRLVLRNTTVIFLNPDDQGFFLKNHLVKPERTVIIPGPGVDTVQFSPHSPPDGIPLVILPARMLKDKGVREFVEAARLLREESQQMGASAGGRTARFALVGDNDDANPASIRTSELKTWEKESVIEWWGWKENMAEVYAQATIICLPSYREGLPKTLIEAAACGKPIIASDVPGCREVVRSGENGLLVPAKDVAALVEAIRFLLGNPDKLQEMGTHSRKRAMEEFSKEMVIFQRIEVYKTLLLTNP